MLLFSYGSVVWFLGSNTTVRTKFSIISESHNFVRYFIT
jgi:hypothetical protein